MKLALVVPGFSASEEDWCIAALLDYVRVLATRDRVHVFALRWPERTDRYTVYGATVHPLRSRARAGLGAPCFWADAVREIAAEHARGPFDLLHAFWADEPGWVAAWAGRRLGVPSIVSLAGGELSRLRAIDYGTLLRPGRAPLVRWGLRRAALVTAGSRVMLEMARSFLPRGVDGAKLRLAPLGVDSSRFTPAGAPHAGEEPAGRRFLNVGSLHPVKAQAGLLRAFARADLPGSRLEIVGAGPLRAALEALAAALGVADRVRFAGAIDHGRMPAIYRACDLLVQSSLHEAQGMAVLEAAFCGLPVLGTATGVLPEIGAAVPAGDEDALAALMRAAPERSRSRPRAELEAAFSLSAADARFRGLYESVRLLRRR